MHLYLIRHAESENNARAEHERVEDPAITPRGVRQAEQLAAWLANFEFDLLLTSPFRRALQTAQPIATQSRRAVQVWCDIYERGGCYRGWNDENYAGAAGLGREGILELIPEAIVEDSITSAGWWGAMPRESDEQTIARAAAVRRKLEQQFGDRPHRVAAIIHAEFQRLLMIELLGTSVDLGHLGPICNAGVTHLTYHADAEHGRGQWRLEWFNAVTHLSSDLITSAKG
ncbi:histidine phosphatase family protein [Candidatus Laterigemmans baculatus]|uniref:histidine phosphatase family protein n=1 Tax=Candidatus Laterigemmans baculatus TaxID=2770505 RepID=UPI0013DCEE2E|nr:histidine phosphatase family protein [Candidatus Laterigemmans baculatus]